MGGKLKQHWRQFKQGTPGRRFQDRYERAQRRRAGKPFRVRLLRISLAILFFIIGVILVFIPGPAFVFLGLSLGMAADQSRAVARVLDWGEVKVRRVFVAARNWWKRAPIIARSSLVGMGTLVLGLVGYVAWQVLLPQ